MNIFILYGILLIAVGALMSGSFAVPFDKIKNWKWENYWLIYSLFAYIIFPLLVCLIFVPGLKQIFELVPASVLLYVFIMGVIYGAANLTFGLSIRYLGFALGFALSLGLLMAISTLVPPLIDGRLAKMFEGRGGILLIAGVLISLVGIGISGYAGFLKSKHSEQKEGVNKEFNLRKGIFAALFVGVTGAASALGVEQGVSIAQASITVGANPLFQNCAIFLVLYAGSFVTSLVWCVYLSVKNKSLSNFVKRNNNSLAVNYLCCAAAGFLWYVNFVFFGMGKSQMGEFSFVAWGILMTLTIVFATVWGLYRGEWKGVAPKIYRLMWLGLTILVFASFLIGMSSN